MTVHSNSAYCVAVSYFLVITPLAAQAVPDPDQLPPRVDRFVYSHRIGDEDEFGAITAAIELDRVIIVLDAMNSRVGAYGPDGEPLSHFGQKGRGPAEFFSPVALATRGSEILVLDRGNQRVVTLVFGDGRLSHKSDVRLPFANPGDISACGTRIFVLAHHRDRLIHEIDAAGEVKHSFGAVPANDWSSGPLSAVGKLVCNSDTGQIAYASSTLNVLRIHTIDGQPVWEGVIPNYNRQEYDVTGGAFRPQPHKDGYVHVVESLHWLNSRRLLVQLRRVGGQETHLRETRLLEPVAGWLPDPADMPRALVLRDSHALFEEIAPYPIIKLYNAR